MAVQKGLVYTNEIVSAVISVSLFVPLLRQTRQ